MAMQSAKESREQDRKEERMRELRLTDEGLGPWIEFCGCRIVDGKLRIFAGQTDYEDIDLNSDDEMIRGAAENLELPIDVLKDFLKRIEK